MTREEYFTAIESSIEQTLDGYKFDNHSKQMFAWRIGARFKRTYDEQYLWQRALFLSSNACKLLRHDSSSKLAVKALKISAEIYEYLSEISEEFDRGYCFILSALCYDISGYQANALCMMRVMLRNSENIHYSVELGETEMNTRLSDENYILFHIQLILLKQIPYAALIPKRSLIPLDDEDKCEDLLGLSLFDDAVHGLYSHILKGHDNTFSEDIYKAYRYYLNTGNVFISHLLHLLTCRFDRYGERSIWNNLAPSGANQHQIWSKYIKLLTNDFYQKFKIKEPKKRRSIFEFWLSQLRAVQQGVLLDANSFIIQMPTSAGKTFVAEIAILNCLIEKPKKKCIYIAPFRALTNEKETELSNNLSKLGYSVSSLSGAYELDEFQDFILESTDVLIATPEKLDLLYRLQNSYFDEVSLLVIDEGHIIGNLNERSALLEFLIIRLKRKLKNLKILFISAVMPAENGEEFSEWISGTQSNIITSPKHVDNTEWQPTRKVIGKFNWISKTASRITFPKVDLEEETNRNKITPFILNLVESRKIGRRTFPKISSKGQTAVALAYQLSKNGNVLIFCPRPDWAESICKEFLYLLESFEKANLDIAPYFQESTNSTSYITAVNWMGDEDQKTSCIKRGIGVHFGDLPEALRKSVEQDFRSGTLRVLISTNTIGQGLNFPIKNLIIHSLGSELIK